MSSPRRLLALLAVLAVVLFMAAAVHASGAEKAKEAEEEAPARPRAEVLKTLPCFGCHSVEKFLIPPGQGAFSHDMHGEMSGLHCSQCHDIKGHHKPALRGEACGACHSTEAMSYAGGGMGKVNFGHAAHGAMFSCGECHPSLFPMKKGASKMRMDAMYQGKLCGKCHDGKTAFASQDCMKCHRM